MTAQQRFEFKFKIIPFGCWIWIGAKLVGRLVMKRYEWDKLWKSLATNDDYSSFFSFNNTGEKK